MSDQPPTLEVVPRKATCLEDVRRWAAAVERLGMASDSAVEVSYGNLTASSDLYDLRESG